ncbi:putative MFS general substrate transporter [Lyophyllum shimeji]|uniref:MFS general substrate transporter n=1 Tax=Lyophyllum shimeji TaxID=47721 RepID=A0A9P3PTF0_LYOSH|nr:putative MFS general substrate transporter [Lyophyllum shimeji]
MKLSSLQRRPPAFQTDRPTPTPEDVTPHSAEEEVSEGAEDPELKLPKRAPLLIMITAYALLQISFFIIVSSSNDKIRSRQALPRLPITGLSPSQSQSRAGGYKIPLHISCGASLLGHILYALAYRFSFLYLILIGRCVSGVGFSLWMYGKRFCADPRLVGIRRRTTLSACLAVSLGLGTSLGPFAGGMLYKVGFGGRVWNGYTAPGWVMAGVWAAFWVLAARWYEDEDCVIAGARTRAAGVAPLDTTAPEGQDIALQETDASGAQPSPLPTPYRMTPQQWGVVLCMCWFSMICFFILGAWESNLPVFGASTPRLHWSPTAAGNFIALGGISAFPFLILNLLLARRTPDRHILALGTSLGLSALLTFLLLLLRSPARLSYPVLFVCWWGVALGFSSATTVTMSTLSKQLPPVWNGRTSLAIQYSNYLGRVTGAVWGGSGVAVGMRNYVGLQIALVGVGAVLFVGLWRDLKTKTG